ncbi:GNAT family N-acetyltransferase [Solibacillus silvestris]|uniref:GNAT family N-acetyltransferase n=1 Tax=Solibacillus silvestris TaxID=76853 RepID=UPI003F81F441
MQIRSLKMEDIPSIENLMIQLGYPSTATQLQERFQRLLKLPDYQTIIAEKDSVIVGMLGFSKQWAYEFDGPYIRILALVVDEKYRRLNIGQSLMQAAEQWALENECIAAVLNSGNRDERIAAHHFYKQLGYIGKSMGFSKRLI